MRPLDERMVFYEQLGKILDQTSVKGEVFLFGDWNARVGERRPGEEQILGNHNFGREAQHRVEVPNRDLLTELCIERNYVIANSLL